MPFSVAIAAKRAPETGADLSLSINDYMDNMDKPEVRDLALRVDCEVDAAMDEQAAGDSVPSDITVTLIGGAEHQIYVPAPKGSPSRPFSRDDHIKRFRDEMGKRLPEATKPMVSAIRREALRLR